MSTRYSVGKSPHLDVVTSSRGNRSSATDEDISHASDVGASSDDEDSSSDIGDISDSEVRAAAQWALREGMKEGAKEGPRSTTTFVAPPTCTQRWANTAWETVKIVVPLSFAACVMYTTAAADLPMTAVALSSGMAGAGVYQAFAARFGREQFKDGLRVAFTQLSTQFVTTMSLRFGLEQLALHVDPTLTATGQFNGTHFDAFAGNLTSNFTEAYAIDHERVFPGGTAWMSLAVLGLPAALFLQSFLIPPRHATTAVDSLVDRLRFDASQGPGKVRARWSDGKDMLIRNSAKAGIGMTGLMVVGGLLGAGQRKLALRILANASLVMSAARARDFTNMLMRGVSPGGPAAVSWPDGGWARQQQVKIPGAVLDALERACTDPDTGEVNRTMKQQAEQLLKVWYRNLFIGGRVSSMPIYTGAGVFGLFIMRDFFSPAVGGIFAKDFYEALSVAVPFSLGTAFTEAVEDPMHTYAISVWAGMNSMPFEIARAPRHPRGKMADNLRQLSFTALLPGHNIVRGLFPSRYQASTVNEDGVVTLSLDDRLELNAGIRAGQNLATMMILTAAGASTDPQFKQMLFLLGVALNGATHFRGNVAAQILESGREARLLYDVQDEILAHQGEHDRAGSAEHAPRDEDSDGDVVVGMVRRRSDGLVESILAERSETDDARTIDKPSVVDMPPLPAIPAGPGVATQ